MTSSNGLNDVRVDVGEGPSSPTLQASVRVRPITIRFTEPGVRDLHLDLHSITSLRPQNTDAQQPALIFDFDAEQTSSPPHAAAVAGDEQLVRDVLDSLVAHGVMGDETVRALKARLERLRDGVKGRRLRLIHAGRILMDGVKLVGYLEELDVRTRVQSRQSLRHLALERAAVDGGSDEDSEEEGGVERVGAGADDDQEAEERDTVERRELTVREMIDWLSSLEEGANDGEYNSESAAKGKGKTREPPFYADVVRLTIRTAPTIYIQCSVGDLAPPAASTPPFATTTDPLTDASLDADANRGFNRLLSAGLSPTEVATIRNQFLASHPLHTSYDLISAHEHQQHLLEMEESWMDTFASSPASNDTAGAYISVMQGLMVGFFLPLLPLFWFRDKPHPSSLPQAGEDDEDDDEQQWENERHALTRESVLGSTMQIAILFGLVANLIMGVFRLVW